MTTHAPLRSRWTKAESVYHVRVTGHGDSLPSPSKDTRLEAVRCSALFGQARMTVARPARRPSRLGFPDALAHGRLSSRGNSGGNVRGVLADAEQDPGLAIVKKVHAQEVEPWEPRDATLLHRKPIVIEHRQVDPAIVKAIPGGPDHRGNRRRL